MHSQLSPEMLLFKHVSNIGKLNMLFPHMIHHTVKHFTAQIETEHFERVLDFLGRVEKYCYPILMISLKQNLDNVSPKHSMETKGT